MNQFSLTFKNSVLEEKFQDYQNLIFKESMQHCFVMNSLGLLVGFIRSTINIDFAQMGVYTLMISFYMFLYYRVRYQVGSQKIIVLYYDIYLILIPYVIYFVVIDMSETLGSKCAIVIYNHIFIQCAIMSQNLLLTSFQFANALMMLILSLNKVFGYSDLYCMVLIYYTHWLQQEYQKVKTNRNNFRSSQINNSLCIQILYLDEIMTKTSEQPLNIFTYNENLNQFEIELVQDGLDLHQYLRGFFIDSKTTLSQYIYQRFILEKQSDFAKYSLSGFNQNKTKRLKIQLFVQQHPTIKFIFCIKKEKVIKCPIEILKEQKLTDMFICKAMNTFKHPNCQEKIQKIFESFKTRVYVSRMVQYYKFKSTVPIFQTWIDFNNVFKIIANQYHLNIEFMGQFQYKGDLALLSSLLEGIIILMRENNQLTCIITQEINQVIISIKRQERLRNLQKIKKTQLFVNLNFLVRQLGFAEISLQDNSLEFSIMKDSFFSYQ